MKFHGKESVQEERLLPLLRESQQTTQEETKTEGSQKLTLSNLKGLDSCKSGTQARRFLEKELSDRQQDSLYQSISIPPGASSKGISDGDLAIQTRLVNKKYNIMDLIELSGNRDADRVSAAVFCIMVGSTTSALVANQNLPGPEILRFIVVWAFSFAPLFFVGYGIKDASKLQTLLVSIQRTIFPAYRKRMLQHEAGHLLMGHLLGWPVAGYRANAVKNAVDFYPLSDVEKGKEYASLLGFDTPTPSNQEFFQEERPRDVPFFSKEGSGGLLLENQSVFRNAKNYTDNPFLKLPSQNEPTGSWPFRGFDEETIDQLAVVSVAGVCAEILAFGNAEGGVADFNQLRQIFNSAEVELNDRDVENRIRFALGYTISQLRKHLGALDAVAAVMERDGSVAECILAIENCENVSGQDGILGDYELRRREVFRSEAASPIERIILGGDKNADTKDDRWMEGSGGGGRKEELRLTGDDPFYAALAVSIGFLLWASNGGLSLH